VAQEFEAQVLGALLQPMFESSGPNGAFGGGAGETQWRSMLIAEHGKAIARARGIGLADAVLATLQSQSRPGVGNGSE
jgi:Rod binding domain-containing protein